ncbi:hypothetical protein SHI21_16790 [Bacteriovorax sp. PP10]|uniref:Uncharacterized protein n=1 Tax=Bacteriovorax antarcticus TaxID=3088717 RepID=A0ABU5W0V2_9BACT|nr:hypothetical protein [Bacteriovorax sp. PP10]MEA9357890.1 hypothetical protein [Bacteriovorax sp. PP10]
MKKYFFLCSLMATMSLPLFAQSQGQELKTLNCVGVGNIWNAAEFGVVSTDQSIAIKLTDAQNIEVKINETIQENFLAVVNDFSQNKKGKIAGVLTGNESGDYGAILEKKIAFTQLVSDQKGKNLQSDVEVKLQKPFVFKGEVTCSDAELK